MSNKVKSRAGRRHPRLVERRPVCLRYGPPHSVLEQVGGTDHRVASTGRTAVTRIVAIYAAVAALWIYGSDQVMAFLVRDQNNLVHVGMIKGFLFIIVTGLLLYQLITRHLARLTEVDEELRKSRYLVHSLVEAVSDAIYVKDLEGRYLLFNAAAAEFVGKSSAEVIGKDDTWLFSSEDAAMIMSGDRRVMEAGCEMTYTEQVTVADGTQRFFLSTKGPIFSASGNVTGLYGIARDITERKLSEDSLARSEASYRSLFDNMLEGFARCRVIRDDNGTPVDFIYLSVNKRFEDLTGLRDVVGKRVSEVIPGIRDTNPEILEIYGKVAATGLPVEFEAWVPPLNSWFSVSVYSPEEEQFVAVFDVVTKRKEAEAEREVTVELLRLCTLAGNTRELMWNLMGFFHRHTGCEAVGVRLKEGDDFPYYETMGFSDDFVMKENRLCTIDSKEESVPVEAGHPALDCMCGTILSGRFDPAQPFFTPRGSFWTSCTSDLLACTSDDERLGKTRNRCNGEGYESVALIPLRHRDQTFGLFQFNDRQRGRFNAGKIALLENLVDYVAIALAKLRTEEELRESSQFYEQIIACAGEGVIVYGSDLRCRVWNPFMEQMTGLPAVEVQGKLPREMGELLSGSIIERLEATLSGTASSLIDTPFHFPRTGRSGWLSSTEVPLRNSRGEIIGAISTLRDITERRLIRERNEHLNRVLRAIRAVDQLILREKDVVALADETCRVLVEYRGYSGALIILTDQTGKPTSLSNTGAWKNGLQEQTIEKGVLPPCCEAVRFHKGVLRITDIRSFCTSCPMDSILAEGLALCTRLEYEGATHGFLVVTVESRQQFDLSEENLFEELAADVAFAIHAIRREGTVALIQEERDRFEAELRHSQKMEAVGRLAGGIAHDFNNMLSVIIGYAELSLAQLVPSDPLYHNLNEIKSAGERSANLTRQLLAFSRKQITSPAILSLNNAISEQQRMLQRLVREEIIFKFMPADELWEIRIDPSQLDQILVNLTVNARDAIEGVGVITIETANETLPPSYPNTPDGPVAGEYVRLTFSDSGCGMEAETLERIFEPFFTTKEEGKGTGLGLATVYGIVRQNNGLLQVQSKPGDGTTFRIFFPRCSERAPVPTVNQERGLSEGAETILLVEDDPQILEMTRLILQSTGYNVLTAPTPGDAVLLCEKTEGDIHLLISDVIMPMMKGTELAARIEEVRPGIRTLFMSGYTSDVIFKAGVSENEVAFLHKPFSPTELMKKVRSLLDSDSSTG